MKKYFLLAVIIIAAAMLVCVFAIWKLHSSTTTISVPPVAQAASAQLQSDLQGITPQFIDEHTTLSADVLHRIEKDIIAILLAQEPNNQEYYLQNGIALSAVGKRYVAFSVVRPTDNPAPIQILDSMSQTSDSYISGEPLFKTDKVAVYVEGQNIYTYKPDQSSETQLPGAKLSGNETYDHCGGCMGGEQDLQATHTDTSFTINTYVWVQGVPKKVRELTFSF
ncbi:MAG: hypothetical protein WAN50_04715 [Minisyncoccia bacterium]